MWRTKISRHQAEPSDFWWISRYGLVTLNVFGKDYSDGGMNEVRLYIQEMIEQADYSKNDALPNI